MNIETQVVTSTIVQIEEKPYARIPVQSCQLLGLSIILYQLWVLDRQARSCYNVRISIMKYEGVCFMNTLQKLLTAGTLAVGLAGLSAGSITFTAAAETAQETVAQSETESAVQKVVTEYSEL